MIVRLISCAVGLVAVAAFAWIRRTHLRNYARRLYDWTAGSEEFWGRLETFLNETGVLYFVFPTLDAVYERARDKPPPTVTAICLSYAAAIVAFFAAVYSEKKRVRLKGPEGGH